MLPGCKTPKTTQQRVLDVCVDLMPGEVVSVVGALNCVVLLKIVKLLVANLGGSFVISVCFGYLQLPRCIVGRGLWGLNSLWGYLIVQGCTVKPL